MEKYSEDWLCNNMVLLNPFSCQSDLLDALSCKNEFDMQRLLFLGYIQRKALLIFNEFLTTDFFLYLH